MNITKTMMTIGLATAMIQLTSCTGGTTSENPLLQESTLPFGAPDFSKIKASDYMPAIKAGIEQQRCWSVWPTSSSD